MKSRVFVVIAVLLALLSLTACGGGGISSLNDVPVFPNAQALQPGQNPMADTLAKNVQQAGGMGASLDQKIFSLPKDATWAQIKSFYQEKLSGWTSLNLPIPDNDMMSMAIWTSGGKNLTIGRLTEPVSKDAFLIFSLSGQ